MYYLQMPLLCGKAKDLYIQAYGQERYDKYTDDPIAGTCHGGLPDFGVDDFRELDA